MKAIAPTCILFPRQLVLILLATAAATVPTLAQQGQSMADPQSTPPAMVEQQPSSTAPQSPSMQEPKEGFWGRVNPFARKKWVNNRVDPLKGRLSELDEVNAKNGRDIRDVDSRAQAGIRRAQSAADAANQTASAAGEQARNANGVALGASGRVDRLNSTVTGLDQYRQVTEADVKFRSGQPALSAAARKQLDDLAASVADQKGYILEIEAHSPAAGSAGIQNSERFAEAVKRYLVTQHEIPVYRLHAVALGNARDQADDDDQPVRISSVHIRLMENSLAAQEVAPPHGEISSNGAARP
jgi:outer membrane protein OmpA-like peptidoglycan-associated protein